MNAKSMLKKALADMGADGLCIPGDEPCGCGLDDFEPCDSILLDECEPAKKHEDGLYYPMEVACPKT
jgi:hypothetical protein